MGRERDGSRLLPIDGVGADHRKIGGACGEGLGGIERAAGIFHPQPDRRIGGGEAAGDDRGDLFGLAVKRADCDG